MKFPICMNIELNISLTKTYFKIKLYKWLSQLCYFWPLCCHPYSSTSQCLSSSLAMFGKVEYFGHIVGKWSNFLWLEPPILMSGEPF